MMRWSVWMGCLIALGVWAAEEPAKPAEKPAEKPAAAAPAPEPEDKTKKLQELMKMMSDSSKKPLSEEEKQRQEIAKIKQQIDLLEAKNKLESAQNSADERNLGLLKYNLLALIEEKIMRLEPQETLKRPYFTFVQVGGTTGAYINESVWNHYVDALSLKQTMRRNLEYRRNMIETEYRISKESVQDAKEVLRELDVIDRASREIRPPQLEMSKSENALFIKQGECVGMVCVPSVSASALVLKIKG